jgi:hypothetical protein
MSRLTTAFFAAAVLYALAGMSLGMFMGATQDFTMRPLHAHINLLGWAGLALMGAFYGVAGAHAPQRLGWAVFGVANVGNVALLSQLYSIVHGRPPILPILMSGELLVLLSMALFGACVLMAGRKPAVR